MKDGILHWKRKCLEAGAQGTANRVILARSRGVSVMASGSSFTDALHPRDFRKNVLPVLSMSRRFSMAVPDVTPAGVPPYIII